MSDSTTAVGAPETGAKIFAFTMAVCDAAGTPLRGVGALAIMVAGIVPGKMLAIIEPEPVERAMLTEVVATLAMAGPGAVVLPSKSANAKLPESAAVELAAVPGATIDTAIIRQISS